MIDDGSTDNSWQVVEELRKKNPCIKGHKISSATMESQQL
jgi:glycosyltransferase involved in cell wall biosynthesis